MTAKVFIGAILLNEDAGGGPMRPGSAVSLFDPVIIGAALWKLQIVDYVIYKWNPPTVLISVRFGQTGAVNVKRWDAAKNVDFLRIRVFYNDTQSTEMGVDLGKMSDLFIEKTNNKMICGNPCSGQWKFRGVLTENGAARIQLHRTYKQGDALHSDLPGVVVAKWDGNEWRSIKGVTVTVADGTAQGICEPEWFENF
jgi:hypothetical protein